jgi:hypothetical protein
LPIVVNPRVNPPAPENKSINLKGGLFKGQSLSDSRSFMIIIYLSLIIDIYKDLLWNDSRIPKILED